ncbi:hypothetical protein [Aeromonas sp. MrichA-1]|uniref:hypothetical protein n=1 Tax=Aeromonas sp. MrichA-1 TaxID=2823362 RepID=UPI001B322898|nr:hypothetical protein [Aeromonas sp. MrichA-1]MBP4081336.1 hypothetical protein [Aeromonas sp. MrichA-1]
MQKQVIFDAQNKGKTLQKDGFCQQKLFCDDVLYHIREIDKGVTDNALFIRDHDGLLRNFIELDFGCLYVVKQFSKESGDYPVGLKWLSGFDIERARDEINASAELVAAMISGELDGDFSSSISHNDDSGKNFVSLGYNLLTKKIIYLPKIGSSFGDSEDQIGSFLRLVKNLSSVPKEVIKFSIRKENFDWIFHHAKLGNLTIISA